MARVKTHHLHFTYVLLLICVLILYVGCSGGTTANTTGTPTDYRTGDQGLELRWHSSNPHTFYDGDDLTLLVDIFNRGTDDVYGELFLAGYDQTYLNLRLEPSYFVSMEGKSQDYPYGETPLMYKITTDQVNLPRNRERFTQSVKLTACYGYATRASSEVCVDPDPYNRRLEDKVCTLQAETPGAQGHPVVINSIQPRVSKNDISFVIAFSNSDNGVVYDQRTSFGKCAYGLDYDEIGLVNVRSVTLAGKSLSCSPLNPVRMTGNSGTITCECINCLNEFDSAYWSVLDIDLSYGYRNTIKETIEIVST